MLTIYANYAPQISHYAPEICHYASKQNNFSRLVNRYTPLRHRPERSAAFSRDSTGMLSGSALVLLEISEASSSIAQDCGKSCARS